jgi:hypothetical protein
LIHKSTLTARLDSAIKILFLRAAIDIHGASAISSVSTGSTGPTGPSRPLQNKACSVLNISIGADAATKEAACIAGLVEMINIHDFEHAATTAVGFAATMKKYIKGEMNYEISLYAPNTPKDMPDWGAFLDLMRSLHAKKPVSSVAEALGMAIARTWTENLSFRCGRARHGQERTHAVTEALTEEEEEEAQAQALTQAPTQAHALPEAAAHVDASRMVSCRVILSKAWSQLALQECRLRLVKVRADYAAAVAADLAADAAAAAVAAAAILARAAADERECEATLKNAESKARRNALKKHLDSVIAKAIHAGEDKATIAERIRRDEVARASRRRFKQRLSSIRQRERKKRAKR